MQPDFRQMVVFDLRSPFSSSFSNLSSTRDSVMSILGFFPGLSCQQLTTLVSRARTEPITHQGVFKVLNTLVLEGVLIKEEKKYFLNKEWLKQAKNFFEQAEERSSLSETMVLV